MRTTNFCCARLTITGFQVVDGLINTLRTLGPARLLVIGVVMIGLLGFFAFITERLTTAQMALLYGGLDAQDSSDVVAKLDGLDIPYKLVGDGTSILVPETEVARLRMMMAEEGLPSGGSMGYEIFDQADAFGTTSFVQNINRVRALEGELSRTIRSINKVAAARVHLVLPQRKLFDRDALKATASIVLRTRGGSLSRSQVQAIQNLVAAAVPGLGPSQVSIVDEKGKLLASVDAGDGVDGAMNSLRDRQLEYENRLKSQLEKLLANYVGPGKAQVEVSVEVDFNRVTTNSEIFDPDLQVVLSTQTVEESEQSRDQSKSSGEVSVAGNLPDASTTAIGASSSNTRTEETTNFENSKTVRTEIHEAGQIKKLSVAVLVDGTYEADEDGALSYVPRTQEELDQLAALVRSAVGFNVARGDVVEIINLPFAIPEIAEIEEPDSGFLGMNLDKADIFKAAELVIFLLVGSLMIMFVGRPFITRLFSPAVGMVAAGAGGVPVGIEDGTQGTPALPSPGAETLQVSPEAAQAMVTMEDAPALPLKIPRSNIESLIDVAQIDGKIQQSAVKKVGEIVEKHPDEAASILRSWLHE